METKQPDCVIGAWADFYSSWYGLQDGTILPLTDATGSCWVKVDGETMSLEEYRSVDENPVMTIEMLPIGTMLPCADRGCELDASVVITVDKGEKKHWCTGHAHCEIAVWMVGL